LPHVKRFGLFHWPDDRMERFAVRQRMNAMRAASQFDQFVALLHDFARTGSKSQTAPLVFQNHSSHRAKLVVLYMSTAVLESPQTYEQERGKPMPGKNHSIIEANLGAEFLKNKDFRVVELSLELDGRPVTPDLSVYRRQPVDFRHDEVQLTEPPLLAVEILSPTQGSLPVMEKVEAYLKSGVKSVWMVNPPQRAITIYTPDGKLKTFVEGMVKDPATGLTADLNEVFS
jgi:Uma2 family endonuclease